MIKVFFGNDTIKVRRKALDAVDALRTRGTSVVIVNDDNYQPGVISNSVVAASLFGESLVYMIDTPSIDQSAYSEVGDSLAAMQQSDHTFVVIEGPLLAAEKRKFEKYAGEMEEYKAAAVARFNNFALADALAKKDKRSLWLLFNEARLEEISLEELVGVLWWQLKTLRLASLTATPEEAGLKEFPYQKAKRALSKFVPGELESLSRSLLMISHDSRRGIFDLDQALERWVLRL